MGEEPRTLSAAASAGERGGPPRPGPAGDRLLVLFDGDCALCDGTVRWLARRDRRRRLTFAPLHGETARRLGLDPGGADPATLVLVQPGGVPVLRRSRAVWAILTAIGGPLGWLAALGRRLPVRLTDLAYDAVARRRHAWFGRAAACSRPADGDDSTRYLP